MPNRCVVYGCNSPHGHRFPNDEEMRKLWLAVIRREEEFSPTKNSLVCSAHFVETDYSYTNIKGQPIARKILKKSAVPSIFSWRMSVKRRVAMKRRAIRARCRDISRTQENIVTAEAAESSRAAEVPTVEASARDGDSGHTEDEAETRPTASSSRPTGCLKCMCRCITEQHDQAAQCSVRPLYRYAAVSDGDIQALTSCSDRAAFNLIVHIVMPYYIQEKHNHRFPPSGLSFEDKLFLTLIKLRHNILNTFLGLNFGISRQTTGRIFISMIKLMANCFAQVDLWPAEYNRDKPVVIVNCTEVRICRPSNPSQTYSTYKSSSAVKILLGVTPDAGIAFVSEAFSGSASDQKVFVESGIMRKLKDGDVVLADPGFNVQGVLAARDIKVVSPAAFLKGLSQLSPADIKMSSALTQDRIQVDRMIGLTKTYKFLDHRVQYHYVKYISEIYFVACFLCCLRPAI